VNMGFFFDERVNVKPRSKILMLIDNFDQGGAQTLLIDLVNGLNKKKFEIIIVSLRKGTAFFDQLEDVEAQIINLSGGKYSPLKLWRLIQLIRREKVNIVHTHLTAARFLGVIAGYLGGARKIFSHDHSGDEYLRKNYFFAKWLLYPLDRILMFFTDQILAVSESNAIFNVKCKKFPTRKVTLCHNWIDADRFSPDLLDRRAFRKLWKISENTFVVGAVGRLSHQKGYRFLVEAAAEILNNAPGTVFVIVGAGEELQHLKDLVYTLEIDSAFRFPGFVSEIEKVYSAFDLFVLPSLYEPFGLVVLEAMAAGLPVVASATGGVVEIVEDRNTGILVPPGDSAALARGIADIMEHRETVAEPMIARAKKMLQSKFDRKTAIARIESLYRDVPL